MITFNYSTMGAGKTTRLLQMSYDNTRSGKSVICMLPDIESRFGEDRGVIRSRLGIEQEALVIKDPSSVDHLMSKCNNIDIILVDEAQFLSKESIDAIISVADFHGCNLMFYGLLKDFNARLFEGSAYLITVVDTLREIETVCTVHKCLSKATHVIKHGDQSKQIEIGGDDKYSSVCRIHYYEHRERITNECN